MRDGAQGWSDCIGPGRVSIRTGPVCYGLKLMPFCARAGDVLKQINGNDTAGRPFMEVMDEIVRTDQCSFTFASG